MKRKTCYFPVSTFVPKFSGINSPLGMKNLAWILQKCKLPIFYMTLGWGLHTNNNSLFITCMEFPANTTVTESSSCHVLVFPRTYFHALQSPSLRPPPSHSVFMQQTYVWPTQGSLTLFASENSLRFKTRHQHPLEVRYIWYRLFCIFFHSNFFTKYWLSSINPPFFMCFLSLL